MRHVPSIYEHRYGIPSPRAGRSDLGDTVVAEMFGTGADCGCPCHTNPNIAHVAPCCSSPSARSRLMSGSLDSFGLDDEDDAFGLDDDLGEFEDWDEDEDLDEGFGVMGIALTKKAKAKKWAKKIGEFARHIHALKSIGEGGGGTVQKKQISRLEKRLAHARSKFKKTGVGMSPAAYLKSIGEDVVGVPRR